jgi:hypothetical protein
VSDSLATNGRIPWQLTAAGVFVGVSAGGFVSIVLSELDARLQLCAVSYDLLAALPAAIAVYFCCPGGRARDGIIGMLAALLAMLAGEALHVLTTVTVLDWPPVLWLMAQEFRSAEWPKLLRYGFGLYLGWHMAYNSRQFLDAGIAGA